MNRKFDYTAQIESYLEGKMSGDEVKAFEAMLQTDPALKAEFQLQKDIVNSLKEYRKAELKSRLDQVNVGSYSGNLTGLKIAITAAISAAVGLGIYYFANQTPDNALNQAQVEEKVEDTSNEIGSLTETSSTEIRTKEIKPLEEVEKPETASNPKPESIEEKEETEQETSSSAGSPVTVVTPKVIESFEGDETEEHTTEIEAPINKLEEETTSEEVSTVEIESKGDNHNSFHYKFYNNKLYLYGDFKNIPYEIIEFNTVSGKSLYLYYQGNYYYLESNKMEMTPLPKIHEEKLIEELDSLRVKK